MPKDVSKELESLIQIISVQPDGLGIDELINLVSNDVSRRTLQYRLSSLVKSGHLKTKGFGKNIKYYAEVSADSEPTSIIPFSEKGNEVKRLISTPLQLRNHVSYQRKFLDSYEPNHTYYLSESLREKLLKLGNGSQKGRPAGTYARKIYQRLLIDLSWNSSRLEGNTYSLLETERLLATGEEAPGKDQMETQMILNHKDAIEFIVDMAEEIDINRYTVLNIHGLLSNNLLADPKACGRLRTTPVKIGQSVYHPIEVPQLIEDYFQKIIQKASLIKNPFEQSFFLMVHLPYLQPFVDVNKRVSRLAGNIPFIRENLSPLSFVDVPEADYVQGLLAVYELNRIELLRDVFEWAYERSASLYLATLEAMGQPDPFRMRYRDLIRQSVFEIVQNKMDKLKASHYIAELAKQKVPPEDQRHFIEIAEVEVSSLHEGNFARFKIRPSSFFEWHKGWL